MQKIFLNLFFLGLFCVLSCTSSRPDPNAWVELDSPLQVEGKSIRVVDSLVHAYQERYFNRCMRWVRRSDIPESDCEYGLLDAAERRFGGRYTRAQMMRVADDILFDRIDRELLQLVSTQPTLLKRVRQNFSTKNELLLFYRKQYSFGRENLWMEKTSP